MGHYQNSDDRIEPLDIDDLALMRAICDSSSDVIFAKDLQGRIKFANPATLRLVGKTADQVIGRTDAEFIDDAKAAADIMANDQRIMQSGIAEEIEEEVPMPDGTRRVWLSKKRPYVDREGRIIGLLGISRDITERKLQEEKAAAAHTALQRVLDSITDGLAVLDNDWRYVYFSETGAKMLGLVSADLIGKKLWDLFPAAEKLQFGKQYRQAMETGVSTHFEEFYPEPLNVWLECHCYPSPDGLSVYFRDVTDRKLAREAAEESDRRLKALLEATPVGLAYANARGELLLMNAECRRLWGDPPEAKTVDDYVSWKGWWGEGSTLQGEPLAAHDWPMARALAGERIESAMVDIEPFTRPGVRIPTLIRSVPVTDACGQITGAVTAQMDMTETLRARTAVEENSRQLRQLANTIPQLAWMADQHGYIHWYNDRWYAYTGTAPSDMEGWGWQKVHHPAMLPSVMEQWIRSLKNGRSFEMTFPLRDAQGNYRPFYTLVEPLKDADGNIVQWFGTNTDVSALESIQNELRKTQHWLQDGLEAARMVAWEWDLSTHDVKFSENVEAILGAGVDQAAIAASTVYLDDLPEFEAAVARAQTTGDVLDITTRRVRQPDGDIIWAHTRGHIVADHGGSRKWMRGILIDVTEQKVRQTALEEASRRKDEFLAMLAHELRNPLAPIATAAHLLRRNPDNVQRVKSSAEIIARQVGHMASLLDDLLDVSRVTRGLIELETEVLSMTEIISSAVEQARPLIDSRDQQLTIRSNFGVDTVEGDRVRLCQVIVNLLTNAAKYSPQGGKIAIDAENSGNRISVTVTDNGNGIDSSLLPHVFELFTQANPTPDRSQGGLGIGLALVRSLVTMHGGTVSGHSDGLGKGSSFVVTLPLVRVGKTVSPLVTQKSHPLSTPPRSILVVDDNQDAGNTLGKILELEGHSVTVVNSPSGALQSLDARAFDAFVLDIGLPEMDGYELARRIQAHANYSKGILVAVTGYSQPRDIELALQAGFDAHMVKPVKMDELNRLLGEDRPRVAASDHGADFS